MLNAIERKAFIPEEASSVPVRADSILIVAATRWEAAPLVRRLRLKAVSPNRFEGPVGDGSVVLLQTGVGAARVSEALGALENQGFSLLSSTGYAGALQTDLRAGAVIVDMPVAGDSASLRSAAASVGLDLQFGRIAHSDRELTHPDEKIALGKETGACAVDMETAALRDWARPFQIPVCAVRIISDAADERLPGGFPADDNLGAQCAYALRHPFELPLLTRLAFRQWHAMPRYSLLLAKFLSSLGEP